jgi:hypothetical protein
MILHVKTEIKRTYLVPDGKGNARPVVVTHEFGEDTPAEWAKAQAAFAAWKARAEAAASPPADGVNGGGLDGPPPQKQAGPPGARQRRHSLPPAPAAEGENRLPATAPPG